MEMVSPNELCWRIEEGEEIRNQLRLMKAEYIFYLEEHNSWFVQEGDIAYWMSDIVKLDYLIIMN